MEGGRNTSKSEKQPKQTESYRPILLLPTTAKLFERLLQMRLTNVIANRNLIPAQEFDYCQNHSTVQLVQRITNLLENAKKQMYSGVSGLDPPIHYWKACYW